MSWDAALVILVIAGIALCLVGLINALRPKSMTDEMMQLRKELRKGKK